MLKIKNKLTHKESQKLIQTLYKTCRSETNLSPRSKDELRRAYNEGRILLAIDQRDVIGWLMTIPYTNEVQELAAGFVLKTYRSKGVFDRLLKVARRRKKLSVIVTFNNNLALRLVRTGFKNSSFWETLMLTNGLILLNRLSFQRLMAVINHYQRGKPSYLIYRHYE